MSNNNNNGRDQLKAGLTTGKTPKESQFKDLIDKTWNRDDDGVSRDLDAKGKGTGPLKIQAAQSENNTEELLAFYPVDDRSNPTWKIDTAQIRQEELASSKLLFKNGLNEPFFILENQQKTRADGVRIAKKSMNIKGKVEADDYELDRLFPTQKLQISDFREDPVGAGFYFGSSVAIDEKSLVIGAPNEGPNYAGSAYVYEKSAGYWMATQKLRAKDFEGGSEEIENIEFGDSVAISDKTIAVGAPRDKPELAGSVYIFQKENNGTWSSTQKLHPNAFPGNTEIENAVFGASVAISDDVLVVGAPQEKANYAGSAYVYQKDANDNWLPLIKLQAIDFPDNQEVAQDDFGNAVAIHKNTILVAARRDEGPGQVPDAGSVYLYEKGENGNWLPIKKLQATDLPGVQEVEYDRFGTALAVNADTIVIGAVEDEAMDGAKYAGSVYIYQKNLDGNWEARRKLESIDFLENIEVAGDFFGSSVALSKDILVIGARSDEGLNNAISVGSVYIYQKDRDGNWQSSAKLQPGSFLNNQETIGALFGNAVAIHEKSILIGAYTEEGANGMSYAGSAYLASASLTDVLTNFSKTL